MNYPEFPDSCLRGQFALLEDPAQVLVHRAHILVEEFGDLLLAQPKGLILEVDLDAHLALRGGVKDDVGGVHMQHWWTFWQGVSGNLRLLG